VVDQDDSAVDGLWLSSVVQDFVIVEDIVEDLF